MTSTIQLTDAVQFVSGIGPGRAKLLARLGVKRVADLIFLFPRSYEEVAEMAKQEKFAEGLRVSVIARVVELGERLTQSGKHMLGVHVVTEDNAQIRLLWFNQSFRKNSITDGQRYLVTGPLRSTGLNWEMVHPQIELLDEDETPKHKKPLPIYPLTEGLKQTAMRGMMEQVLPDFFSAVDEAIPEPLRIELGVSDIQTALRDIHLPETIEDAVNAQRRFKLQELLVLQLAIAMQRKSREHAGSALTCEPSGKVHARILNRLGFQLTPDQATSIKEVADDMARDIPMNRLLQGDVGSGKTVVAQYAMLLSVANGYQAALMAPTEVLARQHFRTLMKSLKSSNVRIGVLTGSMPRGERNETLEQIANGEINLIVGTQALLSDRINFHQLGLVIVDEQHKFGVMQRAKLRTDTQQPHYLVLSATPIPRTIAMTAFGDLDVSTIKTKPPGRAAVHTYTTQPEQLPSWWRFVAARVEEGRQAYVIAPRVAEGDDDVASAEGIFNELKSSDLNRFSIGLLHGRMSGEEKDDVLRQFADGQLAILVATTVVEVGIDVANATVMTILDADRLGLAQLHQLRGRVSRGSHAGYVCAVASSRLARTKPENGTPKESGSPDAVPDNPRLKAFQETDDGFELAEIDLKLRGPGDLLGTSQSGLPTLRIANISEDRELLEQARDAAQRILARDPALEDPDIARLVKQTLKRYGKSMQLSDIG